MPFDHRPALLLVGNFMLHPMRHLLFAIPYLFISAFFFFAFYERFWKWRHQIDESLSSFVTPEGDNLTSGGMFWIAPALLFAAWGIRRLLWFFRRRRP